MARPEIIRQMLEHASPTEQLTADSWRCVYAFPPSFLGFQGHFPDYPVLPAILQFAMVRLIVEGVLGEPCSLDVSNAKFSAPVRPDDVITVEVTRAAPTWKAKISVKQAGADSAETAATLTIIPQKIEAASHED